MRAALLSLLSALLGAACAPPATGVAESAAEGPEVMDQEDDRPVWNEETAANLVGASIIIGITYLHADGSVESQVQIFGTVVSADPIDGVAVSLAGDRAGETYHLPPDLRSFAVAAPGSYRLRSSGITVENPDYTTTWTITRPPSN
ncbi:MAG: hypothetical protein K2X34_11520 [Hyphomonadaceae bacterium]|nr:hypothetical protein [Hyphomonadaceae bacterium]